MSRPKRRGWRRWNWTQPTEIKWVLSLTETERERSRRRRRSQGQLTPPVLMGRGGGGRRGEKCKYTKRRPAGWLRSPGKAHSRSAVNRDAVLYGREEELPLTRPQEAADMMLASRTSRPHAALTAAASQINRLVSKKAPLETTRTAAGDGPVTFLGSGPTPTLIHLLILIFSTAAPFIWILQPCFWWKLHR